MLLLDPVEARLLGSLIEKEIATPEYYPLTLNALIAAANQKSNRDPVVGYDEETVAAALDRLRAKGLVAEITGAGLRVPKYRQLFGEALNLGRREIALLCVLMLRGPQTVGELRERAGRLHPFSDLEEVESVLEHLLTGQPDPLVARLPRQPGTKEARFVHLLSGAPPEPVREAAVPPLSPRPDRLQALETELARLRDEVDSLKEQFARFRAQFE
jgi:uncharacterized protein YceH (UPF0502 family)